MDRETIIQNILTNYGQYGITEETIIPLIDGGVEQGLSYDLIYLGLKMELCKLAGLYNQLMDVMAKLLKMELCKLAGEEFYCTSDDMARAFNVSNEEMNECIREARQELEAEGKDPNDYFREVKGMRFMI